MEKENKTLLVWNNNYAEAKAFYDEHGHFPTHKENRKIRQWANVWWHKYSEQNPDKLQMLFNIGFQAPDKWTLWNKNYELAKAFYKKNGRGLKNSDDSKLYRYFRVWAGNCGKDHPERINLLLQIGIQYKITDTVWDKNFNKAKAFFDARGHFPTRAENICIYEWARQWTHKQGKQHPDLMDKLKSIGFQAD